MTDGDRAKAEELINNIKNKSDDDYEKNVTYISAGTLVLSLTFLEKIIKLENSSNALFLVTAWILMGLTLGLNLLSHQLASIFSEKSYDELAQVEDDSSEVVKNIRRRNKYIRRINWGVTGSMFFGMTFLIIFCSINALNPKVTTKPKSEMSENKMLNTDNYEKKGRTVTIHSSVQNAPKEPAKTTSDTGSTQQNTSSDDKK